MFKLIGSLTLAVLACFSAMYGGALLSKGDGMGYSFSFLALAIVLFSNVLAYKYGEG